jgi:hypothetical protein
MRSQYQAKNLNKLYNCRLKLVSEDVDEIILIICILHNSLRDCTINVEDEAHNHSAEKFITVKKKCSKYCI